MDLEHLRWFQAVADGETVTDTAAAAFITQPAMSRALDRLRLEVGADLFFRSGRGLKITPAGRVFKSFVDDILDTYDKGQRSITDVMSPDTGTVPIGFLRTLGTWFVPRLLRRFRLEHPRVEFELQQRGEAGLKDELLTGSADIIITSEDPAEPAIVRHRLLVEPLALAVPAGPRAGWAQTGETVRRGRGYVHRSWARFRTSSGHGAPLPRGRLHPSDRLRRRVSGDAARARVGRARCLAPSGRGRAEASRRERADTSDRREGRAEDRDRLVGESCAARAVGQIP
jgi:DNA-binding transcriptional LysR family regulator